MAFISIPEQTTIRDSDHQESSKLKFYQLLNLYSSFAIPISILIPLLMLAVFKEDTLKNNPLIPFFFFLIPSSHSSLLNFRLFKRIKNSDEKSLFRSILYLFLRFLFFTFSIIPILLILLFFYPDLECLKYIKLLSSYCPLSSQMLIYSPPPAPSLLVPFPLLMLVSTPSSIYSFYYPLW
ncbi:hypothetical protein P7C65_03s3g03120 [Encephalitozoon intestinalis]|nr:hypothetical protein GPK93_02g01600 [Encephalitozoon intestinalis]UTX44809.1 hypothetical protein GPK93_03g03340 [Encephalitozoon intestinalis]